MIQSTKINVTAIVNAPIEIVWDAWNTPSDIMQWNSADPNWHCPASENDVRVNGKFKNRMEAKDGSFGFDFEGIYDKVELFKELAYSMNDGRKVRTVFTEKDGKTTLSTVFDAESENEVEVQKQGWQAILNSFVKYVESKKY
ncbi:MULTISPECIES: SRPBCC family protein [Sphingobacterium]|uniref:SRPBCC family protein n=1 Tax=Sphingobacterium kitahiroshimense TaxID=470446 RepID=A0ABV0BY85_9SPHI|nr:SRPBCC family protein [Sphingobacterium sp. UDSM-2020]QQD16330.1 SRPBCC family protein [Sphingobacterium sp. UDSM-2020]